MNGRIRNSFALAGVAALLTLSACGNDDDAADEDANGDVAAEGNGSVVTLTESGLGEILVDGDGMTLYLFTVDEPGVSNCDEDCLEVWPPMEGEPEAGSGVDAELLGSIEHDDGTIQATYGDWPLYYYAGDAAAGDLEGQGLNDVWFVLDADGNAVEGTPAEQDDDDDDDGGY
jgi:predicted lipoprotein with Yx(FWY)xxD motif